MSKIAVIYIGEVSKILTGLDQRMVDNPEGYSEIVMLSYRFALAQVRDQISLLDIHTVELDEGSSTNG